MTPSAEYHFDDYLAAGFRNVRVPVRWDLHMGETPPYTINASWLARVHEVVGWGLSRNMTILINSHHDDWIDNATTFPTVLPRFVALWEQVAASFAAAPLSLVFEVYNEPHELTLAQLNEMYATVVPVMRASGGGNNGARPIYLGGLSWMSGGFAGVSRYAFPSRLSILYHPQPTGWLRTQTPSSSPRFRTARATLRSALRPTREGLLNSARDPSLSPCASVTDAPAPAEQVRPLGLLWRRPPDANHVGDTRRHCNRHVHVRRVREEADEGRGACCCLCFV